MKAAAPVESVAWSRRNPFPATLLRKSLLSPAGEPRAKYHYGLSIEGSGMRYEPGDSLAVIPENDPALVGALLARLGLTGDEEVKGLGGARCAMHEVLERQATITKPSRRLREVIAEFCGLMPAACDALDLLEAAPEFCRKLTGQDFVDLLTKLQPRLYSLASSMRAHGEVGHLFVSSVEYECCGRVRKGVCTSYLAERLELFSTVTVFVHSAVHFHLPPDPDAAVIMIGAGTGVAPFRAFLEERRALGCRGKNWLFFGQRHETTGFYYREEWQDFERSGALTRLDTAFADDQPERIYVQHRMIEHGPELWRWLRDGAYLYLCGDARAVAPAVDTALERIAAQCGHLSPQEAAVFVQTLREQKRYRRDVY